MGGVSQLWDFKLQWLANKILFLAKVEIDDSLLLDFSELQFAL